MAVAIPLRRSVEDLQIAHLYKAHAAELLRFAWHRLGRLEDAEDAVQSTFLSAHRVLQEGERVLEPRAWLFRILRNECLTRIAMAKRRGPVEELGEWHADPGRSVAEQVEGRDDFDQAVALLASLPEQQREAMVLREWVGLSAIETADIIDSTPQGVDALVYRARKALVAASTTEAEGTCADVREALAADAMTARERAHLLTCRTCRAASRRLRAPEELAVNGVLPLDGIASRLGESIPGFAAGGAIAAAAAGGGTAVATGLGIKVAAGVAISAMVVGGGVDAVPVVGTEVRPPVQARAEAPSPQAPRVAIAGGEARIAAPAVEPIAAAVASADAPIDAAAPGAEVPAPVAEPVGAVTPVASADVVPGSPTEIAVGAPPTAEAPKVEAPKAEAPKAPKVDTPKGEQPKVEVPKAPKGEAPKGEAPKVESPKVEAPKAPKGEQPKVESPKIEAPKVPKGEQPKVESPKAPKVETPKADTPKAEAPKVESPKVEAPKAPKAEVPKADTGKRAAEAEQAG